MGTPGTEKKRGCLGPHSLDSGSRIGAGLHGVLGPPSVPSLPLPHCPTPARWKPPPPPPTEMGLEAGAWGPVHDVISTGPALRRVPWSRKTAHGVGEGRTRGQ